MPWRHAQNARRAEHSSIWAPSCNTLWHPPIGPMQHPLASANWLLSCPAFAVLPLNWVRLPLRSKLRTDVLNQARLLCPLSLPHAHRCPTPRCRCCCVPAAAHRIFDVGRLHVGATEAQPASTARCRRVRPCSGPHASAYAATFLAAEAPAAASGGRQQRRWVSIPARRTSSGARLLLLEPLLRAALLSTPAAVAQPKAGAGRGRNACACAELRARRHSCYAPCPGCSRCAASAAAAASPSPSANTHSSERPASTRLGGLTSTCFCTRCSLPLLLPPPPAHPRGSRCGSGAAPSSGGACDQCRWSCGRWP